MIIDTHSHLNFKAYENDRDEVIKRTLKEGVVCIDVGTKYETSKRAMELAEKYDRIYAAIGMHPIHIKNDFLKLKLDPEEGAFTPFKEEFEEEKYRELAKSKKVVAIGEIGLDYYYKPKTTRKLNAFKEKQKEVLLKQLKLAKEMNLPVIFHCRMAHQDLIGILKDMPEIKGVIHCFTGSWNEAKQYLDMGFYLGINGIMFKMDLTETIEKMPIEKILVETDCPYLTPPQEHGKRNEPLFVKYIIEKIADLKSITFDEVVEATTQNAKKLFKI
ncbi:MAG: TatD family hydrolase [Candidatus Nealsonbacteria bacterium]|nr:TatD family hydrolase [Candidatus Nealsonbacteria bacterium]